jgi:hypothetical protein
MSRNGKARYRVNTNQVSIVRFSATAQSRCIAAARHDVADTTLSTYEAREALLLSLIDCAPPFFVKCVALTRSEAALLYCFTLSCRSSLSSYKALFLLFHSCHGSSYQGSSPAYFLKQARGPRSALFTAGNAAEIVS